MENKAKFLFVLVLILLAMVACNAPTQPVATPSATSASTPVTPPPHVPTATSMPVKLKLPVSVYITREEARKRGLEGSCLPAPGQSFCALAAGVVSTLKLPLDDQLDLRSSIVHAIDEWVKSKVSFQLFCGVSMYPLKISGAVGSKTPQNAGCAGGFTPVTVIGMEMPNTPNSGNMIAQPGLILQFHELNMVPYQVWRFEDWTESSVVLELLIQTVMRQNYKQQLNQKMVSNPAPVGNIVEGVKDEDVILVFGVGTLVVAIGPEAAGSAALWRIIEALRVAAMQPSLAH